MEAEGQTVRQRNRGGEGEGGGQRDTQREGWGGGKEGGKEGRERDLHGAVPSEEVGPDAGVGREPPRPGQLV